MTRKTGLKNSDKYRNENMDPQFLGKLRRVRPLPYRSLKERIERTETYWKTASLNFPEQHKVQVFR